MYSEFMIFMMWTRANLWQKQKAERSQGRRSTRFRSYRQDPCSPSLDSTIDHDEMMDNGPQKKTVNVWSRKDGGQVAHSTGFPGCGNSGSTSCPPIFGRPNPGSQAMDMFLVSPGGAPVDIVDVMCTSPWGEMRQKRLKDLAQSSHDVCHRAAIAKTMAKTPWMTLNKTGSFILLGAQLTSTEMSWNIVCGRGKCLHQFHSVPRCILNSFIIHRKIFRKMILTWYTNCHCSLH